VNVGRIEDAAQMRALAHPTRLRILGILRANGPQTAAMLGEVIDEAPGTISYHCTHDSSFWDPAESLDDPERTLAANALDHAVARVYAANYEAFVDRAATLGREWVAASSSHDRVLRLSVEELRAMGDELREVVERWAAVSAAHGADDSSEQVFVLHQAYPWPRG
jgi:hypothetical protein